MQLFWVDVRSIALFRVLLGLLLIATYLNYLPFANDLLSDNGYFPRGAALVNTETWDFSVYLANGSTIFTILLLLISLATAVAYLCNYRPRLMAALSFVLFVSLRMRNTEMTFGLHSAMASALFWATFLPYPTSAQKAIKLTASAKRILSIAALGLVLHATAIMYGAYVAKIRHYDFWIKDANALMQITSFYINQNIFTHFMRMSPALMSFLSRATIVIELVLMPMFFIPLYNNRIREIGLSIAAAFLVGITICVDVGTFPLIPLTCMLLLIPTSSWDWWEKTTVRKKIVSTVLRLEKSTKNMRQSMSEWIMKKSRRYAHDVAWIFFAIFFVGTVSNSFPTALSSVKSMFQNVGFSTLLSVAQLNYTWDWIYAGPIDVKQLYAEYKTDQGLFYENVTDTPYRAIFNNYRRDYANSIMDHTWLINRYTRVRCANPPSIVPASAKIQEIRFYILTGDQTLQQKIQSGDIYHRQICPSTDTPTPDASLLQKDPGNLVFFPLLDVQQDYRDLVIDKSVMDNPISLNGVRYLQGFGTHANSHITLAVKGATHFTATAGLDDEVQNSAVSSVILSVEGDGKVLYTSPVITSTTTPQTIDLPLNGVSRLTLITNDAGTGKDGTFNFDDHVDWGSPTVWK